MHTYIDCEIIPSEIPNHHSFRVRTDIGLVFLFQVSDRAALERWVRWFKGVGADNTKEAKTRNEEEPSLVPADQLPQPKFQSATFGLAGATTAATPTAAVEAPTSDVLTPSILSRSSFYAPSAFSTPQQQMNDSSRSALHNPSASMTGTSTTMSAMGNGNSFGVMDSNWRRYP